MSDIIHLLPDSVANQIAAGEVIQRPASVIKELVENAIDAGAQSIQVLVIDSGRTSIQVIDDGKGMSETDARLAFERHATSKISKAADLFELHTMGFRGEALASVAAVAHVTLKTRMDDEELGSQISIAGSKIESQEVISCSKGSNFIVNDLFFNVPARRKFLKSNSTELANITTEFERIVLVHPDISFSFKSNGAELYHLPKQSFRQRIAAVFGRHLDQQLLTLDVETSLARISGFIGRPESAIKRGPKQFFFVNGRYMRHPYFHKAVMEGYNHLIPADAQVPYFLYFEVNPGDIDVNIHPTKTEIKFENETSIWKILLAAVKESLDKFNAMPTIEFDTEGMPDIPVYEQDNNIPIEMPSVHINQNYNQFKSTESGSNYSRQKVDWETLYGGLEKADSKAEQITSSLDDMEVASENDTTSLYQDNNEIVDEALQQMQIKGRYILTSVKSGLMIIDQRRAHIRILYERYMEQLENRTGVSQRVLFPDVIHFSPTEETILKEMMEELGAVGFDLANLGGGSYSINGVPADTQGINPITLVQSMVHSALEETDSAKKEINHVLSLSLAKSAAIVYGQILSAKEITALIDDLFSCSNSSLTPDGHDILTIIKEEEIEKRMG
ncbi:MAG: DNA mismatch repair endonuclease MutL [Bacteroidales bacterium]|nr:DNA mismatch repair endonuclease MutL [Bacteroidales bacterium]